MDSEAGIDSRPRRIFCGAVLLLALWIPDQSFAQGTYMEPDAFLADAFPGALPRPQAIWISGKIAERAEHILGHRYASLRVRYWARGQRSAWILEEIGKERPITTGIVVDAGKIDALKVLIFRESRGWEVRYPFFTQQFEGVGAADDGRLDREIDNITGATLSVKAIRKLARLALMLDHQRQIESEAGAE